ncbi:hypothetical protein ACFYXF_07175 [Streptomyces sp. NPDC002680]|uniref:hypothetical protein n=1 Tax=Streptomyces sp. NPDC002680 TaxID=3364659 RepID=UPI00368A151F
MTDPETVRVYGCHLAPPVGVTAAQLAEEARQEKKRKALMTDAVTKACIGSDAAATGSEITGGCRGTALKQLGMLRKDALTAVDPAQQQGWKRTEADSRAKAVNAKWSARQVDYVTVWQSVETTYQNKIIKANGQELEDVRQRWRNALRKAAQAPPLS